jgi:hypothetical protein
MPIEFWTLAYIRSMFAVMPRKQVASKVRQAALKWDRLRWAVLQQSQSEEL